MRQALAILIIVILFAAAIVIAQDSNEQITLPITDDMTYRVRPADTLDTIGAIFDVSPSCIADMNDISNVRSIVPGQELLISVSCPLYGDDARDKVFMEAWVVREVVTYVDDCAGYRVHLNDSIDMIAFNHNISTASLAIENGIEPPYVLDINQCLIIPEDAPPWGQYPAIQTVAGQAVDDELLASGTYYVIQRYDTLDMIAANYDISVVSLILANDVINTKILQPGMVVLIPEDAPPYGTYPAIEAPIAGQVYLIGEGDTLESIGEAFDKAVIAILATNGIESDADLVVGETILIPYNGPAYGEDTSFEPSMLLGQGSGGETYVIQPLETIDQIAYLYNVDTDCLLAANIIKRPYLVQPGRVLVIDPNCPPYVGYGRVPLSAVVSPAQNDDSAAEPTMETMPAEATEEASG